MFLVFDKFAINFCKWLKLKICKPCLSKIIRLNNYNRFRWETSKFKKK